jgi:small subunit ribosomal protein S4
MLQILERRLDNVIRRAGFGRTIWQSRQIVSHGHVLVNGRKTDRPSYQVDVGDKVSIKDKSQQYVRDNMESLAGHVVPGWIDVNPSEVSIQVVGLPTSDQIPFDVNTNLIVEFYR